MAVLGTVTAVTSSIAIGTWLMSALNRSPGLIAKAAATLDEISGGRFVLGFGAGFAGTASRAFGIPDDRVYDRFEEAGRMSAGYSGSMLRIVPTRSMARASAPSASSSGRSGNPGSSSMESLPSRCTKAGSPTSSERGLMSP